MCEAVLLIPPLAAVGTSVAKIEIVRLPPGSTESNVSNVRRIKKPSVVLAERIGLRVLGER